jgi:hypothetical protein
VSRRAVAFAVAIVVALIAVIAIGRWERDRHADRQNERIARVLAEIGPLDSPSLKAFRYLQDFQCLLYRRGANDVALELCVDADGRVIEAIDRRTGDPWIGSVREEPELATERIDRTLFDRLLRRQGVPQRLIDEAHRRDS